MVELDIVSKPRLKSFKVKVQQLQSNQPRKKLDSHPSSAANQL